MSDIRKKIYYDKTTGSVIETIPEQINVYNVRETTFEEDFFTLKHLVNRVKETVGVIILEIGQHAQDFAECNGYRVNPETKELEFSYPDPNEPEEPQPFVKPLTEQIKDLELKTDQAVMELTMAMTMGGM